VAIRRCGIVRLTAERGGNGTGCSQAWPAFSTNGAVAMAGVRLSTEGPVWGLGGGTRPAARLRQGYSKRHRLARKVTTNNVAKITVDV
jgi:hypothetical protein